MSNTGKWVLGVIVLVIIVVLLALVAKNGTPTQEPVANNEPIKIGASMPLTGDMANIGVNARAAIEIAVEELNATGGVLGRNIEVIYEDDKCASDAGASVANKLVSTDKVVAVAGPVCSPSTLAGAPIYAVARVPLMASCSTAPKITDAGDYVFRNVPSDNAQGLYGAKYAYEVIGKKNAAVLYVNNDWGLGLRDVFTKSFTDLGGTVVLNEGFNRGTKDIRSIAAKVKSSKADIIYFLGFTDDSIVAIKQIKDLGIRLPMLGADAWDDSKVWQEVGSLGDGAMFTSAATNSSDDFKAKMKSKLNSDEIIYCSNYAYDGLKIIAKAIESAGSTDGVAVKNAIYNMKYEGGVGMPSYEFDANGDPKTAVYSIKVVKDGKAELVPTESVEDVTPTATTTTE